MAQETAHIAPTSVWALVRGQGGTSWRPRRMASDAYRTLFQLKEYHLLQVLCLLFVKILPYVSLKAKSEKPLAVAVF